MASQGTKVLAGMELAEYSLRLREEKIQDPVLAIRLLQEEFGTTASKVWASCLLRRLCLSRRRGTWNKLPEGERERRKEIEAAERKRLRPEAAWKRGAGGMDKLAVGTPIKWWTGQGVAYGEVMESSGSLVKVPREDATGGVWVQRFWVKRLGVKASEK